MHEIWPNKLQQTSFVALGEWTHLSLCPSKFEDIYFSMNKLENDIYLVRGASSSQNST